MIRRLLVAVCWNYRKNIKILSLVDSQAFRGLVWYKSLCGFQRNHFIPTGLALVDLELSFPTPVLQLICLVWLGLPFLITAI